MPSPNLQSNLPMREEKVIPEDNVLTKAFIRSTLTL